MLKRGVSLFFLFILTFAFLQNRAFLYGQDILTAEGYLKMVSDHYAGIRDYEANIVIRSGNQEMIGRVSHLSPKLIRIDFTRPAEQVIVYNGEILTVYLPEYRAVLNQNIARGRNQGAGLASAQGLSLLRNNYVTSFLTGPNPEPLDDNSGERVVKLKLTRRSIAEGYREIILSIDPNSRMIRRIEGRTIAEVDVRFDFTNIRTNQGIPEQRFIYDSPPTASMFNNFLFRDNE